MIVRTRKYQLDKKTYIKAAFKALIARQWWVLLLPAALLVLSVVLMAHWPWITALSLTAAYFLFWYLLFVGMPQLDQAKLMFEKLSYEINSQQVLIKKNAREGMPLKWEQFKRVIKGKNSYIFILSKAQIIVLPYKIFNNPKNDERFVDSILKRKGYLK